MRGLTRSASLTHFADVAKSVGLDPTRLLSEFRLPQRCLRDPELQIPMRAAQALLEASAERSGVQTFGLQMAESRQLSNLGAVGLLFREQATLRQALQALVRYSRKLNEALFLTLEEADNVAVLREEIIVGHGAPVRQSTELAIGVAFGMMRSFLGPGWKPRSVCFAHDAPADRSVHERVFGRNVEFGHDFNGIVLSRRDLDLPNPNADPGMARYARQLVEMGIGRDHIDTASRVRELVLTLLGTGQCTIDVVAQHLGVDRRTVHRHLAEDGRTYSAIVDDVRRELAARYVRDTTRSLGEVSSMLGFAAPSGFTRWYRREFGISPSQQRAAPLKRGSKSSSRGK